MSLDLFGAYDIQTFNAEELLNDGYNGERIAGPRGLQELVRQTNGYLAGGRLHTDLGPVRLTLQASHAKDDFIETALKGRRPVLLDDTGRKEPFSPSRWNFSLTAAYVYPGSDENP